MRSEFLEAGLRRSNLLFRLAIVCISGIWLTASAVSGRDYEPMTRTQILEALANPLATQRVDLRDKDFRGLDLSGVDFKRADLFGTHMHGVKLRGANFEGCNLDLTILRGADLEGANLKNASIFGVVLVDANLKGADLSNARLIADLQRANLEGAKLVHGKFAANMKNQPMGSCMYRWSTPILRERI